MLVRIVAPHFVAGFDWPKGLIAPIIKYMKGWSLDEIATYCKKKNWEWDFVNQC